MFVNCKTCIFWKPTKEGDDMAPCYLYPPKPFPVQAQGLQGVEMRIVSVRPNTHVTDGCGEGELPEDAVIPGKDEAPEQDMFKL